MCIDTAFFFSYKMMLSVSDLSDTQRLAAGTWMTGQPEDVVGTHEQRVALSQALAAGQAKGIH